MKSVHTFSSRIEEALNAIQAKLPDSVPEEQRRFFAIKLFERDDKVKEQLKPVPDVEDIVTAAEEELDDDSESIITNERYTFISSIITDCYTKKSKNKQTISDKIDRIVTNRWLALPIFAVVMFVVYFVSVTTVGTILTDWTNDGLFGDGWHLLDIGAAEYADASDAYSLERTKIDAYLAAAEESGIDVEAVTEALDPETENPDASAVTAFEEEAAAAGIEGTAEIYNDEGEIEETFPVSLEDFQTAAQAEEPDPANYGVWVPGLPGLIKSGLESINCAPYH